MRKPRVIVMTDGEIDDHSSMIRFLLYTSEVEVLAIIETNSIFQSNGHSDEDWYEKQLDAYGKIHPTLIKHHPDYPTAEKLRSISYVGDEDFEHLKGLKALRWDLVPGYKITFSPENWPDTPGSDRIVEVLLQDNPDPVHIQAWGGGNTASRAFHKLKTQHAADYQRAVSKVVMYNIWYQDGAGNYIEKTHPAVTMLYCGSFAGTWNYNSQTNTKAFIDNNVKSGHGSLGALYPQTYISEGDSPAFFYTVVSGLRNHEHPTFGGWGGRFQKVSGFENVYADASDDGDKKKSLRRWIAEVNRDFQARMDWSVADEFGKANHAPIVKVDGAIDRVVKAGEAVTLSGKATTDPDGNMLTFKWWQYVDAGTHKGTVALQGPNTADLTFMAPTVTKPETIHLILQVTDNGSPVLDGYQRVIVTVQP